MGFPKAVKPENDSEILFVIEARGAIAGDAHSLVFTNQMEKMMNLFSENL